MKKFLALMALLLCFMVLFVACDNNNEPEPSEVPTDPIVEPAGCEHAYDNACDADCNLCGEKRATAAHVEETLAAVAPTCTKAGLTEGKICTVCGVVTKAQEVAPATGHTEVTVEGTPATCTTAGLTDGTSCSVCNAVVKAQEVIFATGHNVEVVKGKAATCTEDGLTSGKQCSVCKEWVQAQEVISATGHVEVKKESVAPTCTTPGYVGATVCGVCGEVLEGKVTEKALGHVVVDIPEVPSTCTTQGTAGGKMCSRCELVIIEPELQKLANHTVEKVPGYEATCTTAGLKDGSVCKDCGKVIKEQVIIPATHGKTDPIPAVDPTCTTLGYTEGEYCTVCGEITKAQEVLPYAHTYTYGCDTTCIVCGESRWEEPHHEMGFTKNGALGCIHGCGTYYKDAEINPATFASGQALYDRILRSGTGLSSAIANGALSFNEEEGYVRVSGKDAHSDPGMDHVIAVPFGPNWDGAGQSVTQRYLVVRFRTDSRAASLRFVTWNVPIMIIKDGIGTGGDWNTVIVDLQDTADAGERIDIRCNINAEYTDFSHIASFKSIEDAKNYANFVGEVVDGECSHVEFIEGWNGPVCSNCYIPATPVTSHEGTQIYNAIDPTCPDFSHVVDNDTQGVAVNGIGTGLGGAAANFVLTSDVNFGKYMVVVYKMDTAGAYFGLANNGELATYREVGQTPNLWTVCTYGATGLEASNALEFICNFGGASNSVGIKAVYTFDSEAAANAYAAMLATQCFHDVTTLNEATGHNVCNACGAIQGATAEWPLDLESGYVTTPEFVLGENWWDAGIAEYNYFYYAESDHKLVIDSEHNNISITINGMIQWGEEGYASSADIKAGDKVEVKVERLLDEEWNPITDPCFFIADKAVPGTVNNPFELVLGETTTPEFIPGTGFENPGVQQYFYKWVAVEDGKLNLSALDNLSWTVNGNWGDGYVADVKRGDVVEITIFMGTDAEGNWATTPVTFSAELDAVHSLVLNEDGSLGCLYCDHKVVPATYSAGQTLADKASNGNYGNHGVYNAEGGYVTISGASTAVDAGTDKVYNINNGAKERYVVFRYRTTDPVVTFRFVSYNVACAEKWVDLGSNGEWQTVVVDAGANYGGWMEFRCNIYATNPETGEYINGAPSSENVQTDISHIVTFATYEEAKTYAGVLAYQLDGVCPHYNIETGFDALGSIRCTACGFVSTPATYQAMDALYDSVVIANSDSVTDSGAAGIAVTSDKRTGFAYANLGDTVRVQLTSETTYGKYIVVVYNSTYQVGYLALGNGDNSQASMNFAAGMDASTGYRAFFYPGATFEGNTLDLLLHFGDVNPETTTNILGVATFNTKEEAQLFTDYITAAFAG